MKKKKLSIGAIALALAIGPIAQTTTTYNLPVSYATGTDNQSGTTNQNQGGTAGTENQNDKPKTAEEKKAELQALVNEYRNIEKSALYENASSPERVSYKNAIDNARVALENNLLANIDKLIQDINTAKTNLGANSRQISDNKKALALNLQLASLIYNRSDLYDNQKIELKNIIDETERVLRDPNKFEEEIIDQNKKLSEFLNKFITDNNLNPNDYKLNIDYRYARYEEDYTETRLKLYNLITAANQLYSSNEYSQLQNEASKNDLVNAINTAVGIYNNANSSINDLDKSYRGLNLAYNNVLEAINPYNTELNRLKAELTNLVNANHDAFVQSDAYKNGSGISKNTYNAYVDSGKQLLTYSNPTIDQYRNAIKNINIAKLSVAPVKTQTLDGNTNPPSGTGQNGNNNSNNTQNEQVKTAANNVKALLDANNDYKKSEAYTTAPLALRQAYDTAITKAENAHKANPQVLKDLTDAKTEADTAKTNIATFNTNFTELKDLITKDTDFRKEVVYTTAANTLTTPYKDAINKAVEVRDNANRTNEDVQKALNDLKNTKKAITDTKSSLVDLDNYVKAATGFRAKDEYKNGKADLKTAYDDAIKAGEKIVNDKSTDQKAIQEATANIIVARTALETYKSTVDKLQKLIDEDAAYKQKDEYTKASDDLRRAYDVAIGSAKLMKDDLANKTGKEVIKAVDDIDVAKTNLDRAVSERKLQALIDEENTVKSNTKYKDNTDTAKKTAYDSAIANAKTLIGKADRTKAQIEAQITAINTAKTNLGFTTTLPTNTDLETAQKALDALVKNADAVRGSLSFRNAGSLKQVKYNAAIVEGRDLLTKYASDKTSVTTKEFTDAAKKITDALADIGYVANVTYSTNLDDLIAEAPEFRKNAKFVTKQTSTNEYYKQLTQTYDKLIEEATKLKNAGPIDDAVAKTYVARINEVKMAIMDEMSQTELTLRGLVREANVYRNSKEYKDAKNSTNEVLKMTAADYDKLIEAGRNTLGKQSRSDADMKPYVDRIQSAKAVMKDPSERNQNIYKLAHLITQSNTVINDSKYKQAPQAKRTALEEAIKKATAITALSSDKDIESAVSDLEAALNVKEFDEILKHDNILGRELQRMTVSELVELARKVTSHRDFADASSDHVKGLRDALDALDKAIREKDVKAQAEAKTALIAALQQSTIRSITEKAIKNETGAVKNAILDLANLVKDDAKYKDLNASDKSDLDKAIKALEDAIASGDKDKIAQAEKDLNTLLQTEPFKDITERVRPKADTTIKADDPEHVKELKEVLALAKKVVDHPDYANVSKWTREILERRIIDAEYALKNGDKWSIENATKWLKQSLVDSDISPIVKKIQDQEKANEKKDYKAEIEKIIAADATLKGSDKYKKAQATLRKSYDDALKQAKDVAAKDNASEDELQTAYTNLSKAVDALDGNLFEARLKTLEDSFIKNYSNLSSEQRSALDSKIKALKSNENATMDDLIEVETELTNATKLTGNSTPVQTQTATGTTITPVTTPTTTTTPVTTTSTVPATVTPGSIVRTGIKSLIGVVAVLAVAIGAYWFVTNKDKNNRQNRVNNNPDREKKTRTFEGDANNENK